MLYKAENLRRVHGSRAILDIGELTVLPHKIYTLIGPNGAGKTSLLKIFAFLDRPTDGSLYFQDRLVEGSERQLSELRRQVVLLDQNPIMFTGSVYRNVEFGLKVRKVPAAERRRRVVEVLDLVGMASFVDYNARRLSGGETKRVALARALVLQPEVLLCDEPTANVDNENQEIILRIIERINSEQKTSVIFSTHYLSQGQRLAHHTLLLQHGMLSKVVAENIFRATVIEQRGQTVACQLTGQLTLHLPASLLSAQATVVKIHIDPGLIQLNPDSSLPPEIGNFLAGHIVGVEQDSGRVRVTLDAGVKLVVFLAMDRYRQEKPAIGDKVRIFIPHRAVECSRVTPL